MKITTHCDPENISVYDYESMMAENLYRSNDLWIDLTKLNNTKPFLRIMYRYKGNIWLYSRLSIYCQEYIFVKNDEVNLALPENIITEIDNILDNTIFHENDLKSILNFFREENGDFPMIEKFPKYEGINSEDLPLVPWK